MCRPRVAARRHSPPSTTLSNLIPHRTFVKALCRALDSHQQKGERQGLIMVRREGPRGAPLGSVPDPPRSAWRRLLGGGLLLRVCDGTAHEGRERPELSDHYAQTLTNDHEEEAYPDQRRQGEGIERRPGLGDGPEEAHHDQYGSEGEEYLDNCWFGLRCLRTRPHRGSASWSGLGGVSGRHDCGSPQLIMVAVPQGS